MFLCVFMSVFGSCIDCPLAFSGACTLLLIQQDTTLGGCTLPTPPQTVDSTATQTKVTFELRRKQRTHTPLTLQTPHGAYRMLTNSKTLCRLCTEVLKLVKLQVEGKRKFSFRSKMFYQADFNLSVFLYFCFVRVSGG